MSCAVVGHDFFHVLVELLAVFAFGHVYEVDDDDAAHIAQAQLSCNFVGGTQVDVQGVCFLVCVCFGAVAGVDVYGMECFGVLDDDVCSGLEGYGLAEGGLDLACNGVGVEDWLGFVVELDDVYAFGGDECHVIAYLVVCLGVVDVYGFEGG